MAQLIWGVVCSRVITDQGTNSVSYIDAIEELRVPTLPTGLPSFVVATLWESEEEDEDLEIRLRFVGPDGKKIHEFVPPKTALATPRHRINFTISGLRITLAGRHAFSIQRRSGGRWRTVASYPLQVSVLPE